VSITPAKGVCNANAVLAAAFFALAEDGIELLGLGAESLLTTMPDDDGLVG
jgi:hypothetical protein